MTLVSRRGCEVTLPIEEVRSLKYTHEFLRKLLERPALKMKQVREEACRCLRHYPSDYKIDEKWKTEVCEHSEDRRWCTKCKEAK